MNHPAASHDAVRRLAIRVRGVVQGVGFRPFVYNAARARRLTGWVLNEADLVRIEVQGAAGDVEAFVDALRNERPPQARIDTLELDDAVLRTEEQAFEIRASESPSSPRPTIPADLATCRECLAEIRTAGERRYRYPFTNCTNCGPRWSIITSLPYDRPRTSMARFTMCPDCRIEYEDPSDRRFHAQPIACPRCGPMLRLLDASGGLLAEGDEALRAAVEAIRAGRIVALKGLGGFQLLCDATNPEAVARLRQRKHRPDKPLAVMVGTLDEARRHAAVSEAEAAVLVSHEAPIVLLWRGTGGEGRGAGSGFGVQGSGEKGGDALVPSPACGRGVGGEGGAKPDVVSTPLQRPLTRPRRGHPLPQAGEGTSVPAPRAPRPSSPLPIADSVAPGNPYLGVMLPYTPLHHLLMAAVARPIVCTSGNLSEEPMATGTDEALERLGPIADVFLTHNRPIVRPVDDSVVRLAARGLQVMRRARGYAPLAIDLRRPLPTILALGGHLKNTVGLSLGSQVVLSPHIGDLDNVASVEAHRRAVADLVEFFQVVPDAVACDMHPDYASTREAQALAERWGVPLVALQHHHAHVAACEAEQMAAGQAIDVPVLGFSWDGTGFGPDATVWGGEVLRCEGADFVRVAHLRRFRLPGGDRAVRQPRRSALGLLFAMLGAKAAEVAGRWFTAAELKTLMAALNRGLNAPETSSMGRLFDAVAAIVGMPGEISYEGQAAMSLEFLADGQETAAYRLPVSDGDPMLLDWEPLVRQVLRDQSEGVPAGRISARMHRALAEAMVEIAQRVGLRDVMLTGGCFQNALLERLAVEQLTAAGFQVHTHRQVPPGDGGVALGQILVATRRMERGDCSGRGGS